MALLIVIIQVLIYITINFGGASGSGGSNTWRCRLYRSGCAGLQYPLVSSWPNDTFTIGVSVIDRETGLESSSLAQHLFSNGIAPLIRVNQRSQQGFGNGQIYNDGLNGDRVFVNGSWLIPFTSVFPVQTSITVSSRISIIADNNIVIASSHEIVSDTTCLIKMTNSLRSPDCSSPSVQIDNPLTPSPSSSSSLYPLEFTIYHLPSLSLDAIIVTNASLYSIVYSAGDSSFSNPTTLIWPVSVSVPEPVSKCVGTESHNGIRMAIPFDIGILVLSNSGLHLWLYSSVDSPSAISLILSACIYRIIPPIPQTPINSAISLPIYAITDRDVWRIYPPSVSPSSALSVDRIPSQILPHDSRTQMLTAFTDPIFNHTFIARSSSDHHIDLYELISDLEWQLTFRFPTRIPLVTPETPDHNRIILNATETLDQNSSISLTITDIVPCRHPSTNIFVWGSALLISRNLGYSFYSVYTDHEIISFESSFRGSFAFINSVNELWYGQLDSNRLVNIDYSSLTSTNSTNKVFFDDQNCLRVAYFNGSSASDVVVSDSLEMMAQKAIDDDVIRNNLICPYSHITTDVDISDGNVFLDYGDEVDIMIRATPSSAIPSHLFSLAIIDSLLDYVNVSLIKDVKESSLTTIAYRLRLSDSRLYHEQSGSGRSMRNTPIRLIAFDTSGACKQLNYDSNTAQTSRSLTGINIDIYSGCRPGLAVEVNLTQANGSEQDCSNTGGSDISCFPFASDFQVTFAVSDDVSGLQTDYQGPLRLTIIGSGRSPDSMRVFTDDEVVAFNEGELSLWTYSNSDPMQNGLTTSSILSWQCPSGSPCFQVYPEYPNAPEIYLLMRISTAMTPDQMESYCDHSQDILIRLDGLTMDYKTMMFLSSATVVIMILVVTVVYCANKPSIEALKVLSPS